MNAHIPDALAKEKGMLNPKQIININATTIK
jgi:hypothetical protein